MQFPKRVFWFVEYWVIVKSKNAVILSTIHNCQNPLKWIGYVNIKWLKCEFTDQLVNL